MCTENFCWCWLGAERRVKRAQTREQGPPSAPAEMLSWFSVCGGYNVYGYLNKQTNYPDVFTYCPYRRRSKTCHAALHWMWSLATADGCKPNPCASGRTEQNVTNNKSQVSLKNPNAIAEETLVFYGPVPQTHGELDDQEDWAIGPTLRSRFDRKESDVTAVDDKKVQGWVKLEKPI